MKIAFLSSEVAPFAKTGGLADVGGSLPIALEEEGVEVAVIMPRYRSIPVKENPARIGKKTRVYFIEHPEYFSREGLYGDSAGDYADNLDRFSFFCRQSLELLKKIRFRPDLLHCNDWQTALIAVYAKTLYAGDPFFKKVRSLLTIHNVAYQGCFPQKEFSKIGLGGNKEIFKELELFEKINLLKGGIRFADYLTTVSVTYSREIQTAEYGCGLEESLRLRQNRMTGILNGLDTRQWNPRKNPHLAENKLDLQKRGEIPQKEEVPLIGMVCRLAGQKGLDLVAGIVDWIFSENAQFILLGTGEEGYHRLFEEIRKRYPGKASIHLRYDETFAKKIYAGADLFLMPSRYEPCGLGQMIALRYGTIPIARKTGGLADTVTDCDEFSDGNGFVFEEYSSQALKKAVQRALKAYADQRRWQGLVRRAMKSDFSWKSSAKEYVKLYRRVAG